MCGRFALAATGEEVAEHYQLSEIPFVVPRYNIAPTQPVAAVRLNASEAREFTHFQWGLIPSWAKDPSMGSRMINARAETVADKPAFRAAFKRRRCLLPATGFYEWRKMNGHKQPMYIREAGGGLVSLAGLWEVWQSADGGQLETCTILTTTANALMEPIHDRMPLILDSQDYDMWLSPDTPADQLNHLLRPFDPAHLLAYPVGTAVNKPQNDTPDIIEPVR
ncbi:MAG: SOS response-associated peptidase [Anaerolineae bacterium]|uniref:SOS response-associated peptidase n=1 Tax=Promineifilum sp. TaxID=2664178 RepID=UPI001D773386|nr:SOS response-associated peptidase [Anaerolineales bacterium]MCB8934723.1 SOS response-associated peptidase [Promineifilum sp.]MCO5181494.1 SOS response-associated peptidase [Promineifilum sp.]MCW5847216.1 SOS response-associated peptidase [Anaerolineae bacterium]